MAYTMLTPEVVEFLSKEELKGKLMTLRMSSVADKRNTIQLSEGFIESVRVNEETEVEREGFSIQLMNKKGELYYRPECFFGTFDNFEINSYETSTVLRINYKDQSYFIIKIYGV